MLWTAARAAGTTGSRVRLLSETYPLHDVHDTEALCRDLLDRVLRNWGAYLRAEQYEDALTFLIALAWRLSERYDPTKSNLAFSTFCSRILERRVVDWYRSRFGDARYGTRPDVLSLEGLAASSGRSIADVIGTSSHAEQEDVLTHVALGL